MVSRSSNPERHAVLALLSEGYPPLKGRSPTCYSPVRHSTQGRSPFRVRLACVRHAASVDSEPGSNSHVKVLVRFQTFPARLASRLSRPSTAIFNKRLVALLFSVLYRRTPESSPPTSLAGLGRLQPQRRQLILDGLVSTLSHQPSNPAAETADPKDRQNQNVCTFYLVFKEPRLRRPWCPLRIAALGVLGRPGLPTPPSLFLWWRPLGEPCELTTTAQPCQPFFVPLLNGAQVRPIFQWRTQGGIRAVTAP